jgi:hypothetical protein
MSRGQAVSGSAQHTMVVLEPDEMHIQQLRLRICTTRAIRTHR